MATARIGPLLGDLSGSLGSVTFSHRGPGLLLAQSPRRRPRSSMASENWHCELSRWRSVWQGLTADERNHWTIYASMHTYRDRVGNVRTLPAYQWFVQYIKFAESVIPDGGTPLYQGPPTALRIDTPTSLSISFSASGTQEITAGVIMYPAYRQYLDVYLSVLGPSKVSYPRTWVHLGIPRITTTTCDLTSLIAARGITLQESQWVAVRCCNHCEGYWPSAYRQAQDSCSA